jgi:hypothetical protein
LQLAAEDAKRLAKESYPYAVGHTALLEAGLAAARGNRAAAIARAGEAVHAFEAAGVEMELAYARRWLGLLRDNDEGAALIERADSFLRGRAVADPARFTVSQAPGLRLTPASSRDLPHVAS